MKNGINKDGEVKNGSDFVKHIVIYIYIISINKTIYKIISIKSKYYFKFFLKI
jgi:hypothetical protein